MSKRNQLLNSAAEPVGLDNPYVAEHRVAKSFRFARTLATSDFKGLLFCHLISQEHGARKVVSYWNNRDSYKANAEPFKAALGGAELTLEGFHCETKAKREPFWKRVSILSVILAITTVLGFRKTLIDQFHELFGLPRLDIASEHQGPFHILAGVASNLELSFRNGNVLTAATVTAFRYEVARGAATLPVLEDPGVVALEKGQKLTKTIPLKIPEAGDYVLRASATAKAGKWRLPVSLTNEFPIRVWPELAFRPAAVHQLNTNRCRLTVELLSGGGATSQIKCEAILTNYQGTCFERTDDDQQVICDQESQTTEIDWVAQPMHAFQTRTFALYLQSGVGKTHAEWTNLVTRIQFPPPHHAPQN